MARRPFLSLVTGLLTLGVLPFCGKRATTIGQESPTATGTMTIPLTYYNHYPFNHVYTANLALGGQNLEFVVDTGSSNLLAIGDGTICPDCKNEYGYDSTYSLTSQAQKLTTKWSMNFAPIGSAQVQGYSDTVVVGGQTLPGYSFGLVTYEKGIPNIWGLAYGALANPGGNRQTPLFDALVRASGMDNVFSLRLCGAKGGSRLVLGGYDSLVPKDQRGVMWTPVKQRLWYTVGATQMTASAGSQKWTWQPTSGQQVIVDSGTNPLVLPSQSVSTLVDLLKGVASKAQITVADDFWPNGDEPGGFTSLTPAQIAKFPTIGLELAGIAAAGTADTVQLSIPPEAYFHKAKDGRYYLGIHGGASTLVILGTVLMENYIVLHKRGTLSATSAPEAEARLGFYPQGTCGD